MSAKQEYYQYYNKARELYAGVQKDLAWLMESNIIDSTECKRLDYYYGKKAAQTITSTRPAKQTGTKRRKSHSSCNSDANAEFLVDYCDGDDLLYELADNIVRMDD